MRTEPARRPRRRGHDALDGQPGGDEQIGHRCRHERGVVRSFEVFDEPHDPRAGTRIVDDDHVRGGDATGLFQGEAAQLRRQAVEHVGKRDDAEGGIAQRRQIGDVEDIEPGPGYTPAGPIEEPFRHVDASHRVATFPKGLGQGTGTGPYVENGEGRRQGQAGQSVPVARQQGAVNEPVAWRNAVEQPPRSFPFRAGAPQIAAHRCIVPAAPERVGYTADDTTVGGGRMSRKGVGIGLVVVGVGLAVLAGAADLIGVGGAAGFGWKQIVGVVVGLAVAVAGVARLRSNAP